MNLLCIDQYSDLGGAQRTLLDLLPAFVERGWNVRVALPGDGPFVQAIQRLGHPTHKLRARSYTKVKKSPSDLAKYAWTFPEVALSLWRLAQLHRAQFLYVNGPRLLPAAAWVARRGRLPLLFHCHNRLHQKVAIQLAGRSVQFGRAHVVACCRYAAESLRTFLDTQRLRIIYNGVSPRLTPAGRKEGIQHIGVIGRIEQEKGQLEFVKAAQILLRRFPEVRFSIIGAPLFSDGAYMQLVKKAAENLPIDFTGWRDDLTDVFASLDVLAVPSTYQDATPRVVIEALAAGVPAVAFAGGGLPEIIRDAETGFLVRTRTPEDLAARLEFVLRLSPDELARLKSRARASWQQSYSLGRFQRDMCEAVQHIRTAN